MRISNIGGCLGELLDEPVACPADCVGDKVEAQVQTPWLYLNAISPLNFLLVVLCFCKSNGSLLGLSTQISGGCCRLRRLAGERPIS